MKPPVRRFTAEEDAKIRAAADGALRITAQAARGVGAELGRSENAIWLRARYLRNRLDYQKPRKEVPAGVITRACLCCRGHFLTTSRFIRLCLACKNTNAWQAGA